MVVEVITVVEEAVVQEAQDTKIQGRKFCLFLLFHAKINHMKYKVIDKYAYIDITTLSYSTIQDFFDALIPSKKYQHLLIQNKWITIDNKNVQRNTEIKGETLKIILYPEETHYENKVFQDLEIVYEDELFLIVNKPSNMLVHSDGSSKLSMCDLVESYFARENILGSAHPIHRLDEPTQGLLVFSKSVIFQSLIDKLLSEKNISRKYLAFVEGKFEQSKMRIQHPLGKDRHNAKKMRVSKNGQNAETLVQCLYKSKAYSIVKCTLKTGRTHQIRVHLSHSGYPILNDSLYGRKFKKCTNMGLVAKEISFYHPLKEEILHVEGSMSEDLERLYNNLKYA